MNDHPGRFVDDDDVSVFVDNRERDRIGHDLVDPRRRNLDRHDFAGSHAELGLSLLAVDAHVSGFDEPLDGPPAQVGQLVGDIPIEARAEIVARRDGALRTRRFVFGVLSRLSRSPSAPLVSRPRHAERRRRAASSPR